MELITLTSACCASCVKPAAGKRCHCLSRKRVGEIIRATGRAMTNLPIVTLETAEASLGRRAGASRTQLAGRFSSGVETPRKPRSLTPPLAVSEASVMRVVESVSNALKAKGCAPGKAATPEATAGTPTRNSLIASRNPAMQSFVSAVQNMATPLTIAKCRKVLKG